MYKNARKCEFELHKEGLRYTLLTERMVLYSLAKKHEKLIKRLYCNQTIMQLMEKHRPFTEKEFKQLIKAWSNTLKAGNPASCWVAFEAKSNKFIGVFMLDPGFGPGCVELGYVIAKNQWNKGYGFEGSAALTQVAIPQINKDSKKFGYDFSFGFSSKRVSKIQKVCATASVENEASTRILDKLKFKAHPIYSKQKQLSFFGPGIRLERYVLDTNRKKRTLGNRNGIDKYFFMMRVKGSNQSKKAENRA